MNDSHILIVDDDPDTRNIIKTILHAKGHTTQESQNGVEALASVEISTPKLILLDLMMPEMSGYEVVTRLKLNHATQSIPVIILTAKGEDEDILAGYNEYSADYYITKPFTPASLINGVDLVLSGGE